MAWSDRRWQPWQLRFGLTQNGSRGLVWEKMAAKAWFDRRWPSWLDLTDDDNRGLVWHQMAAKAWFDTRWQPRKEYISLGSQGLLWIWQPRVDLKEYASYGSQGFVRMKMSPTAAKALLNRKWLPRLWHNVAIKTWVYRICYPRLGLKEGGCQGMVWQNMSAMASKAWLERICNSMLGLTEYGGQGMVW